MSAPLSGSLRDFPVKRRARRGRKLEMRRLLLSFLLTLGASAAKERWVYLPANFQVDAEADRVIALLTRARAAGYDHALISDSKFARLGTVPERYFENAGRSICCAARAPRSQSSARTAPPSRKAAITIRQSIR
jgi:hypothetical protein